MAYLIGIDIGTSGTKSVLFDEKLRVVASALCEYPLYQPFNGWAEQEPTDWWEAVCASVSSVMTKSGVPKSEVKGIGLSGQMHGLVMLDKYDKVIRRAIIWCDQRTGEECELITDLVGKEKLISITANPALTGFTASKIMWVKRHEPENYEKCAKIMLPKDYIRYMLTGEFATEVSDASGMQLLDVPKRRWSDYVLDKLGIDRGLLGTMYESCEVTGVLTPEAAEKCGLEPGVIVVGGAGDQAAGGVGNGIVREGVSSVTIGTSGVVFAHTDKLSIDPQGRVHTFCHAVPGAWHIMGVTQAAGLSFKWIRDSLFASEKEAANLLGKNVNYIMDKIAETVPAGSDGLIYLPYLMGERTPHLDPDARGVFFGLSARHGKKEMLRAVMEGVVYSLCDCMNIIKDMAGLPETVYASGGGGSSVLWRQILSDAMHMPISVNTSTEGGAMGVAILAGVGAGIFPNIPDTCAEYITEAKRTLPGAENETVYAKYYPLYREIYEKLKPCFKKL